MKRGYIVIAILLLLPILPSRLLNIYVGYETGTVLAVGWYVFLYLSPPGFFSFIRKIAGITPSFRK